MHHIPLTSQCMQYRHACMQPSTSRARLYGRRGSRGHVFNMWVYFRAGSRARSTTCLASYQSLHAVSEGERPDHSCLFNGEYVTPRLLHLGLRCQLVSTCYTLFAVCVSAVCMRRSQILFSLLTWIVRTTHLSMSSPCLGCSACSPAPTVALHSLRTTCTQTS